MDRFVVAMSRRELRGSLRHLMLYGTCMALGIAALVALTGLRAAVSQAVQERARELMGADLMLRARSPFSEAIEGELAAWLRNGASLARVTSFGSMALAERSGRTRLVHVQALEPNFPFYGEVVTDPPKRWQLDASAYAVVDPALLIQLDLQIGERLRIGEVTFEVRAAALKAPGTFGLRASVAPRVFIPARFLESTGLIQQGSLVEYLAYVGIPGEVAEVDRALNQWLDPRRGLLAAERTTARTVERYQRDLSDSFATLSRYLGLIGLTALLLGGVGVATGVRVFVREKLDTAALLRALGARSWQVSAIYLAQAGLLGSVGALVGVAGGYLVQALLPPLLSGFLPVQLSFQPDLRLGAIGLLLGFSLSVLFAAWPLLELRKVTPLRALRRDVEPAEEALPSKTLLFVFLLVLTSLSLWQAPTWRVGWAFTGGILVALGVLAGTARILCVLLRHSFPRRAPFWLRQGIANLFRPKNQTLATVLTLGFGLFLVGSVQLLQANVLSELAVETGPDRPNLVLFDVQRDQLPGVAARLEERGARIRARAPMVPARIESLNGEAARELSTRRGASEEAAEDEEFDAGWALRREYRLTYRAHLTETETLVAGRWWDASVPDGEPTPVSLDHELADRLGLRVGDSIGWNIQGVRVESTVANLRDIDWGRFSTNFFVVFPPGVLEAAPQTVVLLAHLAGEDERAVLQRDLVGEFPNVSIIDATRLLEAVKVVVGQVSLAVRFMAAFTLATGLAVLVAAASTARFQRVREALLLRTLGGRSRTVRGVLMSESCILGALAASVGLTLSVVSSWALVRFWFAQPFHLPLGNLAVLWLATVIISSTLGATHVRSALTRPPLVGLRDPSRG
ncbi:MAG: FtsX-like permease family protein [Myxococcales bacterium]|nr:FtsX-like permease family protein [Myxococcales bacterium]